MKKNGLVLILVAVAAAFFLSRRRSSGGTVTAEPLAPIQRAFAPVAQAASSVVRTFESTGSTVKPLATAPLAPKSYQSGGVTYGTGLNQGRIA